MQINQEALRARRAGIPGQQPGLPPGALGDSAVRILLAVQTGHYSTNDLVAVTGLGRMAVNVRTRQLIDAGALSRGPGHNTLRSACAPAPSRGGS